MLRRALSTLATAVLVATVVAGPLVTSATATSSEDRQVADLVHGRRARAGLPALPAHPDLDAAARAWAAELARRGGLSHSSPPPGGYSRWSENVGVGTNVPTVHQAFEQSPSHDRHMVDPRWTHMGVGSAWGADGNVYVVHQFATYGTAPAPVVASPAPAPAPPTAPAPPRASRTVRAEAPQAPVAPPPPPELAAQTTSVLRALRTLDDLAST